MENRNYVYLIRSEGDGKIYAGFTTDLGNRIKQHNLGMPGYTKGKGPWRLVWYAAFEAREKALAFEKYLKSGSGYAFARKRFL
jgi:predicted GIY-YIG superfamily endonuclease